MCLDRTFSAPNIELTSAAASSSLTRRLGKSWVYPDKFQGDWSNDLLDGPVDALQNIVHRSSDHMPDDSFKAYKGQAAKQQFLGLFWNAN